MATIKVFSVDGVKELKCFDTLTEIPFIQPMSEEEKIKLYWALASCTHLDDDLSEPEGEFDED